jgi:hypothetical protein
VTNGLMGVSRQAVFAFWEKKILELIVEMPDS